MSNPELTIVTLALAGKVRITPTTQNIPQGASLESVTAIVNDIRSSSGINELTTIPFLDDNGAPLSFYEIGSPQISLGIPTFIQLKQVYNNSNGEKIVLYSNHELVTIKTVPTPIELELNSNVRQEDKFFSIKLSNTHSRLSESDGFSPITKIVVFTSKVNATVTDDFRRDEITVTDYTSWISVAVDPSGNGLLDNEKPYEVAVQLVNDFGFSTLSNTILVTPKNVPDTIENVLLSNLLSYQRSQFEVEDDPRGDVILQWSKPFDFNELINANLGVSKYYIKKQLVVENTPGSYDPSGSPIEIVLDVPFTPAGAVVNNVQENPDVNEPDYAHEVTVGGKTYHYKYTIFGSPSDLGKKFRYTVVAENSNGKSPESSEKDIIPFSNPNKQIFSLTHHSTTSSITGAPITIYDGKVSMTIDELSSISGGNELPVNSRLTSDVSANGVTAIGISVTDYKMKLTVVNLDLPIAGNIVDTDVTFQQQVEIVDGATPGTKIQRALNNWVLSFDNVNTSLNNTLNVYLADNFGSKLEYRLKRILINPNFNERFESLPEIIQRSSFKSPSKVSSIGVYSFNDDLTPVKLNNDPAVRLVFKQLTDQQMNGLAKFTGSKKYFPHKDSFPISGAEVDHIDGNNDELEYVVSMLSEGLGVNANVYLRVKIYNDELQMDIDAEESSPVVVEVARDYPQSVTGLNIGTLVTNNQPSIRISWTKQLTNNVAARGGFLTSRLQNRVIVIEDASSSNTPIVDQVIPWSNLNQQVDVSNNITFGNTYKVYVIAEGLYTKINIDNSGNRFDNSIISNNFNSQSLIVTGVPSAPIIEGKFSSDKQFTVLYDEPTNLNGVPSESLVYHFFMNQQDTANFPYLTSDPLVLQNSVATATVTTSVSISKTFTTEASSNNINNLVDVTNDLTHYFSMLAKANVGGEPLLTHIDPYTYTNQTVNGSSLSKELSLISDEVIPQREVVGEFTGKLHVYPGNGVPKPVIDLTGAEQTVTVSVTKVGAPVTDMDIVVENNDALDNNEVEIPQFTTVDLSYNSFIGLFALEQAFADGQIATLTDTNGISYGPLGWNFRRVINSGVTRYQVDFTNLTNGQIFEFAVRFGKTIGSSTVYSEPSISEAAAEAPPAVVTNSTFSVAANTINVSWNTPSNSGGAGVQGNSPLKYKIELLNAAGNVLNTLENSDTQLTAQFSGLINYTTVNNITYSVRISAFYNKANGQLVGGDFVSPRPLNNPNVPTQLSKDQTPIQIRVNAAPVNATASLLAGNNQITGSITTASNATQNLYKMTRYEILLKRKTAAGDGVLQEQFLDTNSDIGGGSGLGFLGSTETDISSITNLINGVTYVVSVRAVPSYSYAQGPEDVPYELAPLGPLSVTTATVVSGSLGKNYEFTFNANGSGNATTVIALAKSANSSSVLVKNLSSSSSNLPSITYSGSETAVVAANQTGKFVLSFAELPQAVSDILIVVGNANFSDTFVFPTTAPQFFA